MLTIFTQKYREECIKSCEPLLLDWLVRLLSNSSALELNLWPCSQNTPTLDRNSSATGLLSSPRWSICLHLLFPWGDQPLGYKGLEVKASHYLYSHCMFPPAVTVSSVLLSYLIPMPSTRNMVYCKKLEAYFKKQRWRRPSNEATSPYSVLSPLLPRIMSAIHIISGASKLGLTISECTLNGNNMHILQLVTWEFTLCDTRRMRQLIIKNWNNKHNYYICSLHYTNSERKQKSQSRTMPYTVAVETFVRKVNLSHQQHS